MNLDRVLEIMDELVEYAEAEYSMWAGEFSYNNKERAEQRAELDAFLKEVEGAKKWLRARENARKHNDG